MQYLSTKFHILYEIQFFRKRKDGFLSLGKVKKAK